MDETKLTSLADKLSELERVSMQQRGQLLELQSADHMRSAELITLREVIERMSERVIAR